MSGTPADPAVEAAKRLVGQYGDLADLPMDKDDLVAAAREALKPIRKLIEHRLGVSSCEVFLEDLMPLVYPESEMPN